MSETLRLVRNYTTSTDVDYTASSADSEFPVENLRSGLRSDVWRTTSVSSQSVIVDLKTTEEIDSIGVFFRANQPVTLTGGATIKIEGNPSSNFTTPALSTTLFLDSGSQVISHFYATAESYRYWRLTIDDPGNPYGYIEIPQLVIGNSVKFDGVARGFKWGVIDPSKSQRTPFGQKYSDVLPTRTKFSFELPIEAFDDFERAVNFYQTVGKTESFMVALDPDEIIWGEKDRFLMWGNFNSDFESTDVPSVYFTMPFGVDEQL